MPPSGHNFRAAAESRSGALGSAPKGERRQGHPYGPGNAEDLGRKRTAERRKPALESQPVPVSPMFRHRFRTCESPRTGAKTRGDVADRAGGVRGGAGMFAGSGPQRDRSGRRTGPQKIPIVAGSAVSPTSLCRMTRRVRSLPESSSRDRNGISPLLVRRYQRRAGCRSESEA